MGSKDQEVAVMFADIVGSTRLYEILGDTLAEELISSTLRQLSRIIENRKGRVIKKIGDEVMCEFTSPDQAIEAAQEMHVHLLEKTAPSRDYKLDIRVGAHYGPIINSEGDIFGDTVNIAARIAGLARGGKTFITGYTFKNLRRSNKSHCRHFTRTTVKGKEQPFDIYDVVWEQTEELTQLVGNKILSSVPSVLNLQFQRNNIRMSSNTLTNLSVGRGKNCDLVISSAQASRQHCRIECNRGKFIFVDNSANGSYINHNNIELFLHQESITLTGEGFISLGESSKSNTEFLLHYSIESP
ncbi:MAG: adenylate cyclase [Gammaproteobacteria bacterium]